MNIKKHHIVSIEKMSAEVADAFKEKYPEGLESCEDDIVKYPKPNGDCFYAVTIELPEDIYLVKIPIEQDSLEDVERWLDREGESEIEQMAGSGPAPESDGDTIPDDKELDELSKADSGDDEDED
ncbi:MAG: hypothetical protein MJY62_02560 [Bacteroidales bacterium]|nr:hypothetical protein [Bacteroidales bacterium]